MTLTWFHCFFYFNPRPPRGGRPLPSIGIVTLSAISIHALREESDNLSITSGEASENFNPRPPRGERPGELLRKAQYY